MPVRRIANSTPENPNLLPSCNDKRLMACICKSILYIYLNRNIFIIKMIIGIYFYR